MRDHKIAKSAAQTFLTNTKINVGTAITELSVDEALVSILNSNEGSNPLEIAKILQPSSRIGPNTAQERNKVMQRLSLLQIL